MSGFFLPFTVIAGSILGYFLYRLIKYGGWRGAMFGSRMGRSVDEMELRSGGLTKIKLRVQALDPRIGSDDPQVGIEIVHAGFLSWQIAPIPLSNAEALRLAAALTDAAQGRRRQGQAR